MNRKMYEEKNCLFNLCNRKGIADDGLTNAFKYNLNRHADDINHFTC